MQINLSINLLQFENDMCNEIGNIEKIKKKFLIVERQTD